MLTVKSLVGVCVRGPVQDIACICVPTRSHSQNQHQIPDNRKLRGTQQSFLEIVMFVHKGGAACKVTRDCRVSLQLSRGQIATEQDQATGALL